MTQDLLGAPPVTVSAADPWLRMSRVTGLIGLGSFVLLFAPIIAISTLGEPSFTATAEEAHTFLRSANAGWVQTGQAVLGLAAVGLIWFVVGLALQLARAEDGPPWRAAVAGLSGLLLPAYLLANVSWNAATYGGAEIEPGLASYAFDLGNLGFANAWLAMGSFAVAAGWLVLETRVLGRWLGWWAVVAGVGLVLCRFVWTSDAWFAPYFLFWIWVVIVSVQLVRGRVGPGGGRP
jgi:hypothetical protein